MNQAIMVVDDDPEVRQTIELLLRSWYPLATIHGFSDGGRALAALPRIQPTLVVTDIGMPFLTGRDFAGMANLYDSPARFVVVSGNADARIEDLQQANPKVLGLLRKPFSATDLRRLCDQALA